MNFFKKIWLFALAGLIVLGISTHIFLRGRTPAEPIHIYRTTQPIAKPHSLQTETATTQPSGTRDHSHDPLTHDHSHDHPHDHSSHDHAAGPTIKPDKYDWRDDSPFDTPKPKTDPWKNLDLQQTDGQVSTDSDEDNEVYPPPNWHLTKDPKLLAEYFHAQLINQFGDTPEVKTIAERERKRLLGIPVTIDEQINFLEAQYELWPHEQTLRTLESLQKEKEK